MKKKIITVIAAVIIFTVFLFQLPLQAEEAHWAEKYIQYMQQRGIFTSEDGEYYWEEPISRGEFSAALAQLMHLPVQYTDDYTDIEDPVLRGFVGTLAEREIIKGFPDGTFRPDKPITRAQLVTMVGKALGITTQERMVQLEDHIEFIDIPDEHWAANYIRIAAVLDIISGYPDGSFKPERLVSRSEAAKILTMFDRLDTEEAFIDEVYPKTGKIRVNTLSGSRELLVFHPNAVIGRNNRLASLEDFLKTDRVFLILNEEQQIKYVKAYGLITQKDVSTEISQMTNQILSPQDVDALAKGDFNVLKPKLITEIRFKLLQEGFSTEEIESLLNGDWNTVQTHARERMKEVVSQISGLPLNLVDALFRQDWEQAKELAKIEALQFVIEKMLQQRPIS